MKANEQKAVGHTVGPWTIHNNIGKAGELGIVANGAPCIIAVMCNREAWPVEAHANARLIACAPEMLAALEACVGALDLARCYWHAERAGKVLTEFQPDLVAFEKALRASRAIIARAKGEEA